MLRLGLPTFSRAIFLISIALWKYSEPLVLVMNEQAGEQLPCSITMSTAGKAFNMMRSHCLHVRSGLFASLGREVRPAYAQLIADTPLSFTFAQSLKQKQDVIK